ncbi:MAG: hypothetical protein HKN16_11995 [Saprospiraceae bacterium]|nr:hypothetical protein [Saprospiraceae bacterium]
MKKLLAVGLFLAVMVGFYFTELPTPTLSKAQSDQIQQAADLSVHYLSDPVEMSMP